MGAKNQIGRIVGALIVLQAGCCACAPSRLIPSVVQGEELIKIEAGDQRLPQVAIEQINPTPSAAGAPQQPLNSLFQQAPVVNKQQSVKVLNADKLKRGLTNFMNQLSPGSFFLPTPVQQIEQQKQSLMEKQKVKGVESTLVPGKELSSGKSSSEALAEKSAIVNAEVIADAPIKRPNRLSQARLIGGPLRWG